MVEKEKKEKLKHRRELALDEFIKIIGENNIKNCNVLDIGCGDNYNKKPMEKMGFHWIGLDPIHQKNVSIKSKMEDIPIHSGMTSVVFCSHAFEHTTNPLQTLKEFKRILKPQGLLFMVAPYPTTHQIFTMDKTHYFVLNPDQLSSIIQKSGFTIIKSYIMKDEEQFDNIIIAAICN